MDSPLTDAHKLVISFRLQSIAHAVAADYGLLLRGERLQLEYLDQLGQTIIRGILDIAVKDEQVLDLPDGWFQMLKHEVFPRWLLKLSPVRYKRIWAVHLFPEINIPPEYFDKQYVQFRVRELPAENEKGEGLV